MKITILMWMPIFTMTLTHAARMVRRSDVEARCRARTPRKIFRVPLTACGQQGAYYCGKFSIGEPKQTFSAIFDTGSSLIWVPDDQCTSPACQVRRKYDKSLSHTYNHRGRSNSWEISYYDGGNVRGEFATDLLTVGGTELAQTFGLALKLSDHYVKWTFDGVFGLGPNAEIHGSNATTFLRTAVDANMLSHPIFSVYLPSHRRGPSAGGEIVFGGIDPKRYTGDLAYVDVVNNTEPAFWAVTVEDVGFNFKSMRLSGQAVIDTASPAIHASSETAGIIHGNIFGARFDPRWGWQVPCCHSRNTLDSFFFRIAGRAFRIPLVDLVSEPVYKQQPYCLSKILGDQAKADLWTLGVVFIKNNYCVFDGDPTKGARIGIAQVRD